MISVHSKNNFVPLVEGISIKTLVHGERTLMTEVHMMKNSTLPVHHHPYEQTGYMISGRMNFQIDKEIYEVNPGDSWMIPKEIPHGAEVIEDSVVLEIFSPPREDYKRYFDKEAVIHSSYIPSQSSLKTG